MLIPFEMSRVHPSHMAEACGKTREPTRCIHHWIWKVKKYPGFEATKIKRQLRFAAYLSKDMHNNAGNSGVSPFHTICRSFSKDFPVPFLQLLGFSPVILASTEHGTDICAHRSFDRDCGIWKNPSWEEIILRAHSRIWNNFWIFLAMGISKYISKYDLKLLIQPPLILHLTVHLRAIKMAQDLLGAQACRFRMDRCPSPAHACRSTSHKQQSNMNVYII